MAAVTFDIAKFRAMYPEFDLIADPRLQGWFDRAAATLLDNTDCSPIPVEARLEYFNMLVAHYAALYGGVNGQPPSGIVGRISNATEGSVSVGTSYAAAVGSRAWYDQTPYGAEYWQATAQYRTWKYQAGISCAPLAYPGGRLR